MQKYLLDTFLINEIQKYFTFYNNKIEQKFTSLKQSLKAPAHEECSAKHPQRECGLLLKNFYQTKSRHKIYYFFIPNNKTYIQNNLRSGSKHYHNTLLALLLISSSINLFIIFFFV